MINWLLMIEFNIELSSKQYDVVRTSTDNLPVDNHQVTSTAFNAASTHALQAWHLSGDAYATHKGDKPWISEMYGYAFAAAKSDVWHKWDIHSMIYPGYQPSGEALGLEKGKEGGGARVCSGTHCPGLQGYRSGGAWVAPEHWFCCRIF